MAISNLITEVSDEELRDMQRELLSFSKYHERKSIPIQWLIPPVRPSAPFQFNLRDADEVPESPVKEWSESVGSSLGE